MRCPFCAEKIKKDAIICRFCNRSLLRTSTDGDSGTPINIDQSPELTSPKSPAVNKNSQRKSAVIVVSVILLIGAGFGAIEFFQAQEEKRIVAELQAQQKAAAERARKLQEAEAAEYSRALLDDSWLPSGFTKFSLNPYVAYKKDNSQECTLDTCFPFEAITAKYCSSLYIEGNSGKNGVVYDWSNDTAQGVLPGLRVKMRLEYSHDGDGTSTTFTEVNCN